MSDPSARDGATSSADESADAIPRDASAPTDPALRCLGGRPPPYDARFDVRELILFPPGAKRAVWTLLGPSLGEPLAAGVDAVLNKFCERFDIPEGRAVRAMRICRLLLREGARRGVPEEALLEDLAALGADGEDPVIEALRSKFDEAMKMLRTEIVAGSLADHGKLLVGLSWRVDEMRLSHRGSLQQPVVQMTLNYKEGTREERVTLQLLPDMVEQLRRMCETVGPQE